MRRFKKVMFSRICSNVSVEMDAAAHSKLMFHQFHMSLALFYTLMLIATNVAAWFFIFAGIIGLYTVICFHEWFDFKSRVISHQESKDHG